MLKTIKEIYREMKIFFAVVLFIPAVLIGGCGGEKNAENPTPPKEEKIALVQQSAPQLTGWEIITLPNHPRLADTVAGVREFYKNVPPTMVDIVDRDKDAPQSILFFQKEYADAKVERYEQKDVGEVDKIICYVSKTGKRMTFEEFKPILMSYFPVQLVRENFVYDRGVRFYDNAGSVIYSWQYKSNGANWYRGKPPYDGNLTVLVQEDNGAVSAFGMFLGKDQSVPFVKNPQAYSVEPFDIDFPY